MKNIFKKIFKSPFIQPVLSFMGFFYIRLVYATSRWQLMNKEIIDNYVQQQKPFIICFWHGRLLMLPCAWLWDKPFHMLLSLHRDGALIARVLKCFHIDTIEGSTKRGGAKAARSLVKTLRAGVIIGITPDGPRGPAYKVAPGVATISKLAKVDIIPVSYSSSRGKVLNTWDKFFVPFPFGKGVFVIGQPITPPRTDEEIEECCMKLEKALNDLTIKADGLCWE